MLKTCLCKCVYEWEQRIYMWSRALREDMSLSLCKCAKKKICLIAITPPSIQTGTCYHSSLLLEETSDFYSFWPRFPFSIWKSVPLPRHTPRVKPLSFLRKYGVRKWILLPHFPSLCLLTKAPHSPSVTSALPLLKEWKGKWIVQPLLLSVSSATLLPLICRGTLHHSPSFSLLNTQIGNEFYCPCPFFPPQYHPIVAHAHCLFPFQP